MVKEIENVTPLRVSQAPDAESALSCKVEYDVEQPGAVKTRGTTISSLVVRWTDRSGNELRPAFSVPLLAFDSSSGGPDREISRSPTSSDQRSIEKLARQIVAKLELAW